MPMFRALALATPLFGAALSAHAAGFTIASANIEPGRTLTEAQVFKGFGCEGKNISPVLKWSGAPSLDKASFMAMYRR